VTSLAERKTRLVFETSDQVRECGAWRPVIVEAHAGYAVLRLKGLRGRFEICYGTVYQQAARIAAERARAEKKAAKKRGGKAS
jgi:hypothetical protein